MTRLSKTIKDTDPKLNGKPLPKEITPIVRGSDLLRNPSIEVPWLVENLLQKTGISILAGMSDLGKSAYLRQLGLHIVTNETYFCGYKLNPTHNKVIYFASEDDEAATCSLLHRVCDGKYQSEQLDGLRFIFYAPDGIEDTLREQLTKEPADLVVVDCLMDFMGKVNINIANEVRTWLNPFKHITSEFSTHIIFLHHLSKRADEREPNKASLLGSGALEHAPRCVLELRNGDEPEQRYLCILKANYLKSEIKDLALELRFDNMRFTSLGNTKPKSELVTVRDRSERSERIEQVKELAAKGLSQRKIAEQLKIGVATVNKDLHEPLH